MDAPKEKQLLDALKVTIQALEDIRDGGEDWRHNLDVDIANAKEIVREMETS